MLAWHALPDFISLPSHAPVNALPESLFTLARYLEQSLDQATNKVMTRHTASACTVHLMDPSGSSEDLKQIDTISASLANDILVSTSSGANQMHTEVQLSPEACAVRRSPRTSGVGHKRPVAFPVEIFDKSVPTRDVRNSERRPSRSEIASIWLPCWRTGSLIVNLGNCEKDS